MHESHLHVVVSSSLLRYCMKTVVFSEALHGFLSFLALLFLLSMENNLILFLHGHTGGLSPPCQKRVRGVHVKFA